MIGLENAKRLKELGVYPYGTGDTGSDIKHTLSQLLEEVEKQAHLPGRVDHEFTRFPDSWGYTHTRCGEPYPEYFSGTGETQSNAAAVVSHAILEEEQNT